jgi:Holliday junction resolvase RusA-like endonuclease
VNPDLERAFAMTRAMGVDDSADIFIVTRDGAPWSKSRPRFAKGKKIYVDREDRDAEELTAWHMRRTVKEPLTGNVALGCVFYRPNRQRIDVDNMLKHVCDAANGVLWLDDSQCTAIMGVAELDAARPRTIIVVARHESTLLRGTDAVQPCTVCGEPIKITSPSVQAETCSRACRNVLKGQLTLAAPILCPVCGSPFARRTSTQKLCSAECRTRKKREPKPRARNLSHCADCGIQLSHGRGGRCRSCWRSAIAKSASAFVEF